MRAASLGLRHQPKPAPGTFCSTRSLGISLLPGQRVPIARQAAVLRTVPSSRILTRKALTDTVAQIVSSGRDCNELTSSCTASIGGHRSASLGEGSSRPPVLLRCPADLVDAG